MQTIGKFEVIGSLGRGSQSSVLLARDPDLQRTVAIKLLRLRAEPAERRAQLLGEARAVGTLRHPGIVSIYEAGEHRGDPYLVFEHVDGCTLAQLLRERGRLSAERSAALAIDVLDALEHAHQAGIVHRDLKPSNILVDASGQARVMDFGIAARIGDAGSPGAGLSGTPAYMAPEYVARGEVGPQNDVFAAGLVLYEMLFGRRAIGGDGVFQILHRIANEPLVLPADAGGDVDELLIDVIAKSTAKDPSLRYPSAHAMQDALRAYLHPQARPAVPAPSGSSTLDFLLLRMRHKSDFPAMSAAIGAINRLALSDRADAGSLSNAILKDLALTNKILRLANSAYYRNLGGGRVSTVSRAIVILGFDTVRNLAISLMLFEHIRDKAHADRLKDEFLRANLRGLLARTLGEQVAPGQDEQAFICGLFHGLGRLLAHYYFREEADMIARLVVAESCSESTAAARVLGMTYQDLGIGVARSWGFPDNLVHSMRRLASGTVPRASDEDDRLRLIASCADELGTLIEESSGPEHERALALLIRRYATALPLSTQTLGQVRTQAVERLRELSQILNIAPQQSRLSGLLCAAPVAGTDHTRASDPLPGVNVEHSLPRPALTTDADAGAVLTAGIQDISQALVDDGARSADLLRAIAEIIYRALRARRVLVCLREADTLCARHGFGADVDEAILQMRFALGGRDLFNLILAREVDVLVSDASADRIRSHLPDWFRRHFDAQSFIVLPLRLHGSPVAMIYAEAAPANGIRVGAEALALLRTLRNQAVLAIKLGT